MTGIAIGVKNFYYGIVTQDDKDGYTVGEVKAVRYLNNITLTPGQDTAKAFGDDQTVAIAVSNGDLEVSMAFVSVPIEDQAKLTGSKYENNIIRYNKDDVPPDVAIVYERTNHDGSSEWFGLMKGKFTRSAEAAQTKEDSVNFQNRDMSATFMPREFDGDTHMKAFDDKGSVAGRDEVFQEVFGQAFPGAPTEG